MVDNLGLFMKTLDFIRENDSFKTVDLQRFLSTGYSRVIKVIDVLLALKIIEADDKEKPIRYSRSIVPERLDVNLFYNGTVYEKGDELTSGWDPALFRTKKECFDYVKESYGGFKNPVYKIDTIRVGCGDGWELVDREIIDENL